MAGRDVAKAAKEQKGIKNHAMIMFVFDNPGKDPVVRPREFNEYLGKITKKLHTKYGAADPAEFFGYQIRKQYAMGNGIEVLADLDADDYREFGKKYSGIDGAIKILYNTEKVMTGAGKDPAKAVSKLIRKLEIEAED
jgi:hypothetical protein